MFRFLWHPIFPDTDHRLADVNKLATLATLDVPWRKSRKVGNVQIDRRTDGQGSRDFIIILNVPDFLF